jgi:hypothetical protein
MSHRRSFKSRSFAETSLGDARVSVGVVALGLGLVALGWTWRSSAPSKLALAAARRVGAAVDSYVLLAADMETVARRFGSSQDWPGFLGEAGAGPFELREGGEGRIWVKSLREGRPWLSAALRLLPAAGGRGVVARLTRRADDRSGVAANEVLWRAKMLIETGEIATSGEGDRKCAQ